MDPTYIHTGEVMHKRASGARDIVLQEALNKISSKVSHFEKEGLRKTSFSIGVLNVALTAYVIGKWPELYWCLYLTKAIVMVFYKLIFVWYPARQHYFFLDFCWISNGIFFFLFVLLLLEWTSPAVTQNLFLIFFAVANGPLAWSVIALQNKLVFHNFEWTSTLFIHMSPGLASWGIHWNRERVLEVWGSRFEDYTQASTTDLFLMGWGYYCAWWACFTAWMLLRGLHYPEQGYETVFDALAKAHKFEEIKPFKGRGLRTQITIYMALHFLACTVTFGWSCIMWKSQIAHTAFLVLCFLSAVIQGSSWYLYAIQRAAVKQIEQLMDEKANSPKNTV
ncbi:hypothetical protein TrCOL_g10108 [Triparma columacea]|uniref:Glycerophosphocholine acyltransferase 1 n=1 Tax=Triparma columacea TaxID=722753 RepID=A0A9W7GD44_9STRA|nr:hypothetical protein TrCOL_g10108 [Triparma columacea]